MNVDLTVVGPDGREYEVVVLTAERASLHGVLRRLVTEVPDGGFDAATVSVESERLGRLGMHVVMPGLGLHDHEVLRVTVPAAVAAETWDEVTAPHAPASAPATLASRAPGPTAAPRSRSRAAILVPAVIALLVLGGGIGALAARMLGGHGVPPAVADSATSGDVVATAGDTGEEASRATASPETTVVSNAADSTVPGQMSEAEADRTDARETGEFQPGQWVKLASFAQRGNAEEEAGRLRARGVDAQVYASDDIEELLPGFSVVLSGPIPITVDAADVLAQARRAGVKGAAAEDLSAAALPPTVEEIAGTYTGKLHQISAKTPSLNFDIRTDVVLRADGTGTISYDRPTCTGTLAFERSSDTVAFWTESIGSGTCVDAGQWRFKPRIGDLMVTWRKAGVSAWVGGTAATGRGVTTCAPQPARFAGDQHFCGWTIAAGVA